MAVEWMYVQDSRDDLIYKINPDEFIQFCYWMRRGCEDDYSGMDYESDEVAANTVPAGKEITFVDNDNMPDEYYDYVESLES